MLSPTCYNASYEWLQGVNLDESTLLTVPRVEVFRVTSQSASSAVEDQSWSKICVWAGQLVVVQVGGN